MLIKRIAILGGTGFVGRSLCNRLSQEGYELKFYTVVVNIIVTISSVLPGLDWFKLIFMIRKNSN